ncbi:electron transport complex subunit RsxC [Chitinispirillales bacterium ANBcel5]|uniref:electron transport complex subunit RsxC n=1 Tax=Cellulosispirillum alkaliphilum TaxID=3039283 RepID=UPI002A528CF3|nr:electron transport complex subunit RsxC [Chitinispirillales bacterium ANBcel5]
MFKKYSFKGGIHPPHNKKQTESLTIEEFAAPDKVIIPLSQHIGAPAKAVVKRGDRVCIGQTIGDAGGFVSAPVHSSVSGTVKSVGMFPHPTGKQTMAVEIENDGTDEFAPLESFEKPWKEAAPGELIQKINNCGIVGMGGATFPTHVKLSPPSNKPIDTLIINGAECEPYLTADHRLMLERTEGLLTGALITRKILGAKRCTIAIEDNKADAIAAISQKLSDPKFKDLSVGVLKSKYPQGGEKQLINAVTSREVPSGGLPMDIGCVVENVSTALAIYDAIIDGKPLYQRVVTITGPLTRTPKNLLVRIGTPVMNILQACDVDFSMLKKVVTGGPMMGIALSTLDVPVIKSTSGLLTLDEKTPGIREYPCINCGKCVKICPMKLIPSRICKYAEKGKLDDAAEWNLMDCMECGSCTYTCPSKINLVHYIRLGKYQIQAKRAAQNTEQKK